jgi:hypothetical protein
MKSFQTNLVVSTIGFGSALAFILSAYDSNNVFSPLTNNETYDWLITFVLGVGLVYFVTDFITMIIYYKPEHNVYFFHHIIGLISITVVYLVQYNIIKYLLCGLMYEISTPFLNISLSYREQGITNFNSKLFQMLFFGTFTLVRIFLGTYTTLNVVPIIYQFENPLSRLLILMPVLLQVLNYYWYVKILKMMKKAIFGPSVMKIK